MVPVKTRAELYGHEATELLRIISMYPGLSEKQLCRFYPGREDVTRNLLSHLCRQGRTRQADEAAEKVDTTAYIWYNIIIKYRRWYHG